jgi:hypothetical protein
MGCSYKYGAIQCQSKISARQYPVPVPRSEVVNHSVQEQEAILGVLVVHGLIACLRSPLMLAYLSAAMLKSLQRLQSLGHRRIDHGCPHPRLDQSTRNKAESRLTVWRFGKSCLIRWKQKNSSGTLANVYPGREPCGLPRQGLDGAALAPPFHLSRQANGKRSNTR